MAPCEVQFQGSQLTATVDGKTITAMHDCIAELKLTFGLGGDSGGPEGEKAGTLEFRQLKITSQPWILADFLDLRLICLPSFASEPQIAIDSKHRAFFQKYCVRCHNAEVHEGKVRLDDLALVLDSIPVADRWQKVLNALNSGEMPPDGETQPVDDEKADLLNDLSQAMVAAQEARATPAARSSCAGSTSANTRIPCATCWESKSMPENCPMMGAAARWTPWAVRSFSRAINSNSIWPLRKSPRCGDHPRAAAETKKQRVEPEVEANRRVAGTLRNYYLGGYRMYKLWKASSGRPPSDFGLVDDREMDFRKLVWDRNAPAFVDYLTRPEAGSGAFLTIAEPNPQVGLVVPDDAPAGEYMVRARVGVAPNMPAHRSFMEIGLRGDRADGPMNVLACQRIRGTLAKPEVIEIKLTLPASKSNAKSVSSQAKAVVGDRVIAFRERQPNSRDAAFYAHFKSLEETGFGIEPAIWIDWVEWEVRWSGGGPLNPFRVCSSTGQQP